MDKKVSGYSGSSLGFSGYFSTGWVFTAIKNLLEHRTKGIEKECVIYLDFLTGFSVESRFIFGQHVVETF